MCATSNFLLQRACRCVTKALFAKKAKKSNNILESTVSPYVRVQRDTSCGGSVLRASVQRATFLHNNIWIATELCPERAMLLSERVFHIFTTRSFAMMTLPKLVDYFFCHKILFLHRVRYKDLNILSIIILY